MSPAPLLAGPDACSPPRAGPGADPVGTTPALDDSPERTPPAAPAPLQPRPRGSWQGDASPPAPRQPDSRQTRDRRVSGLASGTNTKTSMTWAGAGGVQQSRWLGHRVSPAPPHPSSIGKPTGNITPDMGLTQAPQQHRGKARGVQGHRSLARAGAGCCLHTRVGTTVTQITQDHPRQAAVPSRQGFTAPNVPPSCSYDSLRRLSPGNSQRRFSIILSSVL